MRTFAYVMTIALLLVGCGDSGSPTVEPSATEARSESAVASSEPTASESRTAPEPGATPTPSASAEPSESASADAQMKSAGPTVELWFVRESNGPWLQPEKVSLDSSTPAVARATLNRLFASTPRDPGLQNLLPDGTELLDVNLRDSTLTVDLDFPDDETGLGSSYEVAAFGQIVNTATQFSTVRRVRILEEGRTPPSGHSDWSRPLRRDANSVSPVIITEPQHGAGVASGALVAKGSANVFEATVLLTLRNPAGKVHKKTFTTATCGTGCRGTWRKTFRNVATPGRWTLIAAATDPSDGEGPPPFRTKRVFTVR